MAAGYGSRKNIPQDMVAVQLLPFINPSWWSTLVEMGIKSKTFEQVTENIKSVANIQITLHDRRLDFLEQKEATWRTANS